MLFEQRIIDVADYIFGKNYSGKMVANHFKEKWGLAHNALMDIYREAVKYNQARYNRMEAGRNKKLVEMGAKELDKMAIERDECLQILAEIAKGYTLRQTGRISRLPTDIERIKAIQVISDMYGWSVGDDSDDGGYTVEFKKDTITGRLC